jgi:pantoate--beta-alanine ligase
MRIVSTLIDMEEILSQYVKSKNLGFVPTMGALHLGHIGLIEKSIAENDFTICSIFVNPTQFNNPKDLEKYPNQLQSDIKLLKDVGCDVVFTPTKEEVYPERYVTKKYNFGNLDAVMEGANRPGHFNGVAMVISRFFELLKPHKAYFGEKDFQQLAIVRDLVKQGDFNVCIVPCKIAREESGLAMSSRNIHLNESLLLAAPRIYRRLLIASEMVKLNTITEVRNWVENAFANDKDLDLEYFEISNPVTLQSSQNWETSSTHIACIAVFVGEIRLIDNILLEIN